MYHVIISGGWLFILSSRTSLSALLMTRTRLQVKQFVDKKLALGLTYLRIVRLSQQKWNLYPRKSLNYNEPSMTTL